MERGGIKAVEDYTISLSDHPLFELADAGSMLEYLINNASDEVLRERVRIYALEARTLRYSSLILYETTGEEKYRIFGTAMSNFEGFWSVPVTNLISGIC